MAHADERAGYKRRYNESHREQQNLANRNRKQFIKAEVFAHYGNACACCGEAHSEFLCIDHVNGGGMKHRKEINVRGGTEFYAWLRSQSFPVGFQTLCQNCNSAKSLFGSCPHTWDGTSIFADGDK